MLSSVVVRQVWQVLCVLACVVSATMAAEPATAPATGPASQPTTRPVDEKLVQRLRALRGKEGDFGPAYQPIYHAALPWYEEFGGPHPGPVDDWAVQPEVYAAELADALEQGRNYVAENPGAGFPLFFQTELAGGTVMKTNYLLNLPAGFDQPGRKFPLIVDLHGSGWIAHKISFGRGGKTGGRCFQVTPINERAPWSIEFLNAYLDELCRIFPIDQDRIYVAGHSMGGIATWEWAMSNPERFAAISPRSAYGSPFRVARLKHVPAWVVHGAADDSVPCGYGDQMVFAMQAAGETVKYTLIPNGGHNLPPEFDRKAVIDWFFTQTRSHEPASADPLESLGINEAGFSEPAMVSLPQERLWMSQPVPLPAKVSQDGRGGIDYPGRNAQKALFAKVRALDGMVDSLVRQKIDPEKGTATYFLPVPQALLSRVESDAQIVTLPPRQGVRFYWRGDLHAGLAHAKEVFATLKSQGRRPAETVWMTPLVPLRRNASSAMEFWIPTAK